MQVGTTHFFDPRLADCTVLQVSVSFSTPKSFAGVRFKSAAPWWGLVNAYKEGRIDAAGYTDRYIQYLDRDESLIRAGWSDILDRTDLDRIALLCWEHTGFCHRTVLHAWMTRKGLI